MTNDLVAEINLRFTSGNGIPVERASIRAEEWQQIKTEFDRLKKKCAALALLHYGPAAEPTEERCACGEPLMITKTCKYCDNDE